MTSSLSIVCSIEPLESRRFLDAGDLDIAFNDAKAVSTDFAGTGGTEIIDMEVLPDGGILAAGVMRLHNKLGTPTGTQLALAKYLFDGSLDPAFGTGGMVSSTPRGMTQAAQIALTPDGGFLVLGKNSDNEALLLKFTRDGLVDILFAARGKLGFVDFGEINSFAVDAGGRILVASSRGSDAFLRRYTPEGAIDAKFRGDTDLLIPPSGAVSGKQFRESNFVSVSVDPQGRILVIYAERLFKSRATPTVIETTQVLYRLTPSGKFDREFGDAGNVSLPVNPGPRLGAVLGNGKITVVAADRAIRFNDDGSPDTDFGTKGRAGLNVFSTNGVVGNSFAVAPDGSIVRVLNNPSGNTARMTVERIKPNGRGDETVGEIILGSGGQSSANAVTMAPDGTVIVGGQTGDLSPSGKVDTRAFTLARLYNNDGPAVQLIPRTLRTKSRYLSFNVLIRDDDGVNASSLNNSDLKLFDINGSSRTIRFLKSTRISDNYYQATYRVIGPGSTAWSAAANGLYEVRLQKQQIFDVNQNAALAQVLGTVRVKIG